MIVILCTSLEKIPSVKIQPTQTAKKKLVKLLLDSYNIVYLLMVLGRAFPAISTEVHWQILAWRG
jgi:hypothetical protein